MDAENNILGNYTTNKRPGDITSYSRRIDITYRHPNPGIVMGTGFTLTYAAIGYTFQGNLWWRHQMKTVSAVLAGCEGNPPVTAGFPSQRPITRSFHIFFDVRLNKRFSKHPKCRWFETPSRSLLRHPKVIFLHACFWLCLFVNFGFGLTSTHTHVCKHIDICNNWRVILDLIWSSFANKRFWLHSPWWAGIV